MTDKGGFSQVSVLFWAQNIKTKPKQMENQIFGRGRFNFRIRGFNLRIRGLHLRTR